MQNRTAIYVRHGSASEGTVQELISTLHQRVEDQGDVVASIFTDDATISGKGKNRGWRRLLTTLDDIEQIVLADAGDLPGRTVADLLGVLAVLTENGVNLVVPSLDIDTATGSAAVLELIRAFRRAKVSQAIRRGQEKARAAGKHVGRPPIPVNIRRRIVAALSEGHGIRPTARRYNVAPSTVISLRQEMLASADRQAA